MSIRKFIVVGNVPFSVKKKDSKGTGSNMIANEFIKLINHIAEHSAYVTRASYDNKTFIKHVIDNPNLKEIIHHTNSVFNISSNIKTCTLIFDNTEESDTFIYKTNDSSKKIIINKNKNVQLSSDIDKIEYTSEGVTPMSSFYKRGNLYRNTISGTGDNKIIVSVGKRDGEFEYMRHCNQTIGHGVWKVIFQAAGGSRNQAVKIAGPEWGISGGVVMFPTCSEKDAILLRKWFIEKFGDIVSKRSTYQNTRIVFDKFPAPDWYLKSIQDKKSC
jgi:hypothetical protein